MFLAGCGGGSHGRPSPPPTKAGFAAAADRVCRETKTHRARIAGLRKLQPPAAERDLYVRWLGAERLAVRAADLITGRKKRREKRTRSSSSRSPRGRSPATRAGSMPAPAGSRQASQCPRDDGRARPTRGGARHRRDRGGARHAVLGDRAADPGTARPGAVRGMRFTMAQPEVSCHPESLLPDAQTVVAAALCYYAPAAPPGPGEGRLPRYTWSDRYAELRKKLDTLARGSGRSTASWSSEPARRPGGDVAGRSSLLRQEHDADHAAPRLLGRPRHARHRRRGRADSAARAGLRRLPPLHRRCPTGALDEPGTLDANRCLSYWTQAPAPIPEAYREPLGGHGLRLRHLPGRLPVEPRHREAPCGRSRAGRADGFAGRLAAGGRTVAGGALSQALRPAPRSKVLRRNALVALGNVGGADVAALAEPFATGDDDLLREHAEWALARIGGTGAAPHESRPARSAPSAGSACGTGRRLARAAPAGRGGQRPAIVRRRPRRLRERARPTQPRARRSEPLRAGARLVTRARGGFRRVHPRVAQPRPVRPGWRSCCWRRATFG